MKIALIRGQYLNKYEMQNYEPLVGKFNLVGFSSLEPIHKDFRFPLKKLFSPVGLLNFPFKMPILNRICLGDAMYLLGLEKALEGFDIAHTRETYFHFTQQALQVKRNDLVKKVLVTCSETIPFNHEGVWRRKSFKIRAIKEADHFHALTEKAKTCLIKEGCNPRKITVIPYGVDREKFKVKSSRLRSRDSTSAYSAAFCSGCFGGQAKLTKLLFVGRLVKEKGIYDLLRAFVQLIKEKYKVHLTIIGRGPEKENITNLINQINFARLIEVKEVSYDEMPFEYQKADIFILPSKKTSHWEEYYGMALTEAMASGLAIVTTDCGAIPEASGRKALISPQGDTERLFKNILALITSPSLRKKYQREAWRWARGHFDAEKQANKIGKLYERILT